MKPLQLKPKSSLTKPLGSNKAKTFSYEIQIWDTKLKFDCPVSNQRYPRRYAHLYQIDERPFVNTESLKRFDQATDYPFAQLWIYHGVSKIQQSIFRSLGKLTFNLICHVLVPGPNLDSYDCRCEVDGIKLIDQMYRDRMATLGQIGLIPSSSGFSEVQFTEEKTAQKIADSYHFDIRYNTKNNYDYYSCNPVPNYLDFYFPINKKTLIQFSFQLETNETENTDQVENARARAEEIIHAVVLSLEIGAVANPYEGDKHLIVDKRHNAISRTE